MSVDERPPRRHTDGVQSFWVSIGRSRCRKWRCRASYCGSRINRCSRSTSMTAFPAHPPTTYTNPLSGSLPREISGEPQSRDQTSLSIRSTGSRAANESRSHTRCHSHVTTPSCNHTWCCLFAPSFVRVSRPLQALEAEKASLSADLKDKYASASEELKALSEEKRAAEETCSKLRGDIMGLEEERATLTSKLRVWSAGTVCSCFGRLHPN